MRKLFLLFSVLFAISFAALAQTRTITGTVIGGDDKQPIVGVTITIKGSTAATATDVNGKFSIKTANLENVTVGAKYIGYQYQEITLKPGEMTVNFTLAPTNSTLNEVVVTGYGNTQKSKILGSVSEIKGAEIEDIPVANLGTALMNRVAGVNVSVASGSGRPGATTTLTLQGAFAASATAGLTTDPLYVIDGLIAQKSDFDNLDASLVESISFLKDAEAAIYGAAADKGVVLVTTKKGKPGKAVISYSGYFGTTDAASLPKMLTGSQEAKIINDGLEFSNATLTSRFSQADLDFIASNPYPSWFSQLWHASHATRHTISVSGGTEKVTFFGGASYYGEDSNFGTTSIKKYNIRSGMTAKITDELTAFISLNTSYSNDYRNTAKSESSDAENTTFGAIIQVPAWVPLTINGLPNYWNGPSSTGGAWNPLQYFNSGSYTTVASQVINLNSSLEYRPHQIKGLTAKVQFGKNNYLSNSKNYYPPYTLYNFNTTGQNGALYTTTGNGTKSITNSNQVLVGTGATNEYELIGSLDYSRTIKQHTFGVLLVATQNETNTTSYNTFRTTQLIPGVDQLFAFDPSTTTAQGINNAEGGNLGYIVRANYDFASKYLIQFVDRLDGSANFGPDHRWGNSPALGLGWRISEEGFFKKSLSKYISSLKFRYSVGVTGDDRVNAFLYKSRFTPYSGTALFGTTVTNGLDPSVVPNPNLTWEHNRAQTFGIDATFLDDRLSVSAEVWNKHYYDGLLDLGTSVLPLTFGNASAVINYNQANTWGETFTVGYVGRINKDWGFNANVNFGWGDNQVTQTLFALGALGTATEFQNINALGELSSVYGSNNIGLIAKGIIRTQAQLDAILAKNPNYTIEGKTPQVGWMDYVDLNGDGKILAASDEGPMYSSLTPKLSMGWTWGVNYRTLRLSVNGFFQWGGKVSVTDRTAPSSATVNSSGSLNQPYFWADHWTPSTPDAAYPRGDSPDISENSTFWTRSGTRLYINNATLSYTLPKAWADRFKIPSLKFLVTGENLWAIINPFDYKDVRTSNIQTYPMLRTISLGVNLSL